MEGRGMPVLVGDLALLLVGLDEHTRVADEVRVALGQDQLHRLRVHEGDEPEHALLLVRDAHVVDGAVDTAAARRSRRTRQRPRMVREGPEQRAGNSYLK